MIYRKVRKNCHLDGMMNGQYYLTRANDQQQYSVAKIFGKVTDRYTKCLFHPDLKLELTGCHGSFLGRFDACLGEMPWIGCWIESQRSVEAVKI